MLKLTTRDDLQNLVDEGLAESLTLEYKASPALGRSDNARSELVKDVTALANSAGGQIIYGIVECDGVPVSIDEGVDRSQFTPEWIEQVVATNSSPRLQSISITEIRLSSDPVKVAYVLTVPQSEIFAPHQNSKDNKYYRRFERRSVPMADYEIRDAMRRNEKAYLEVEYLFEDGSREAEIQTAERSIRIKPVMRNISSEPSLYSFFELAIDNRIDVLYAPSRLQHKGIQDRWGYKFQSYALSFAVPNEFPLVSTISVNLPDLFEFRIPRLHPEEPFSLILAYSSASGSGSSMTGMQRLTVDGFELKLSKVIYLEKDGRDIGSDVV